MTIFLVWDQRLPRQGGHRMAQLSIRRVVTGHDSAGKAIVAIDELAQHSTVNRKGAQGLVVWSTDQMPADNTEAIDGGRRKVATSHDTGTVFRILQLDPGVAPRNHRTD